MSEISYNRVEEHTVESIAQSMQDSAVETLHYLDAWLHKAQGKGYFRSLVKLLYDAGSIGLQ